MVKDAKDLMKLPDKNIIIDNFIVYKCIFLSYAIGMCDFNKTSKETEIFLCSYIFALNKNICFHIILHEALHSQNLKRSRWVLNNCDVSIRTDFLEGLNDLLVRWLIKNYSQKYILPKGQFLKYNKQVKMVKEIIDQANVDMKEVFINYINFNPKFFEAFVSQEYFKNNKY